MLQVTLQDLQRLITSAVDAGIQAYQRGIDPEGDRIKQREAERYIKRHGFQAAMLQKWTNAKLITGVKSGSSPNSPVFYSLADIKRLISSIQLKQMYNENQI